MFIAWNIEIVKRLKTGSIKNVLLFGGSMKQAAPPYVVVKPIAGGDRKLYQIFVHNVTGTQDKLEAYIFNELPELLKEPLKAGEQVITVRDSGAWMGPYVDEGDNTLAMSRDFYTPIIL